MIPMMILSGAMFSFDKLNRTVGRVDKVPFIAELMPTRWSYEALMVHQFKNNKFNKKFYLLEKDESKADFKKVYIIPELRERLKRIDKEIRNISHVDITKNDLLLIYNEIRKENKLAEIVRSENQVLFEQSGTKSPSPVIFGDTDQLLPENFNMKTGRKVNKYLKDLDKYYGQVYSIANQKRQNMITYYLDNLPDQYQETRDQYFNESISDIVKKIYETNKVLEYKGNLIQNIDPIYQDPIALSALHIRTHFLAPRKPVLGKYFDTYWYNMVAIWLLTGFFYVVLYYDGLKHLLSIGDKLRKK